MATPKIEYNGNIMKDLKTLTYEGMKLLVEKRGDWRVAANQFLDRWPMEMTNTNGDLFSRQLPVDSSEMLTKQQKST
jgi:hypothetical protein